MILYRFIRSWIAARKSNKPVLMTDAFGHEVSVHPDDLQYLIDADIIDARAAIKEYLVWEKGVVWHLETDSLRRVIEAAQHYEDVEEALILMASGAVPFHLPEDE